MRGFTHYTKLNTTAFSFLTLTLNALHSPVLYYVVLGAILNIAATIANSSLSKTTDRTLGTMAQLRYYKYMNPWYLLDTIDQERRRLHLHVNTAGSDDTELEIGADSQDNELILASSSFRAAYYNQRQILTLPYALMWPPKVPCLRNTTHWP